MSKAGSSGQKGEKYLKKWGKNGGDRSSNRGKTPNCFSITGKKREEGAGWMGESFKVKIV